MKKIIYALLAIAPMMLSSCDDDDVDFVTSPTASGTVTDDMGNVYDWVRVGNLDWTTSNARNGLPFTEYQYWDNFRWSYVSIDYIFDYSDADDYVENGYFPQFGNLMSFEEACNSAPAGWRLPTDEDWKNLERALGMTDADNKGWRGANGVASRLMESESGVGLGLQLGGGSVRTQTYGWMELSLSSVKEAGYFWTSTAEPSYVDEPMAYFRKLVYGVDGVERQCSHVENLMSVRWCRDAE